jgi:hypothetical protein
MVVATPRGESAQARKRRLDRLRTKKTPQPYYLYITAHYAIETFIGVIAIFVIGTDEIATRKGRERKARAPCG